MARYLSMMMWGVGRREADPAMARPDRRGAGVGRVVEAGLRVADDVHRRDVALALFRRMNRHRQLEPVDLVSGPHDLLDRAGRHVDEAARRFAQAPRQRRQIVLPRHAQRAALRPAVLDQDVAEPEVGVLGYVLEQDRPFRLRRQRADVVDRDRLLDRRQDIGVGPPDSRADPGPGSGWSRDARAWRRPWSPPPTGSPRQDRRLRTRHQLVTSSSFRPKRADFSAPPTLRAGSGRNDEGGGARDFSARCARSK